MPLRDALRYLRFQDPRVLGGPFLRSAYAARQSLFVATLAFGAGTMLVLLEGQPAERAPATAMAGNAAVAANAASQVGPAQVGPAQAVPAQGGADQVSPDCDKQAWPYREQRCVESNGARQTRAVRILSSDPSQPDKIVARPVPSVADAAAPARPPRQRSFAADLAAPASDSLLLASIRAPLLTTESTSAGAGSAAARPQAAPVEPSRANDDSGAVGSDRAAVRTTRRDGERLRQRNLAPAAPADDEDGVAVVRTFRYRHGHRVVVEYRVIREPSARSRVDVRNPPIVEDSATARPDVRASYAMAPPATRREARKRARSLAKFEAAVRRVVPDQADDDDE